MRSSGNRSPRRAYQPQLESIEGRCLPGNVLGLALLPNLAPFPDLAPLTDGTAPSQTSAISPAVPRVNPVAVPEDEPGSTGPVVPGNVKPGAALDAPMLTTPLASEEDWVNVALAGAHVAGVATGSLQGTVFSSFCAGALPQDPPPGWPFFPAGGVWVLLGDQWQETAGDGTYAFTDVPPGGYTAGFFLESYGEARAEVSIAEGETSQLDIHFPFWIADAPGQFQVRFQPGTTTEEIDALNAAYGVTVLGVSRGLYRLQIPSWTYTDDFIAAYRAEPIVQSAGRPPIIFCP